MEGQETINNIIASLQKVDEAIINNVINIKNKTKKEDLVNSYNDKAYNFFDLVYTYTKNKSFKLYKSQLEQAIQLNRTNAIKHIGLYTLLYADKIYTKNSEYFLKLDIPDHKNSDYNILQTSEFKLMWLNCTEQQKNKIMSCMVDLIVLSHAYFLHLIE